MQGRMEDTWRRMAWLCDFHRSTKRKDGSCAWRIYNLGMALGSIRVAKCIERSGRIRSCALDSTLRPTSVVRMLSEVLYIRALPLTSY